jgi:osmotically-inducible protein OsmY
MSNSLGRFLRGCIPAAFIFLCGCASSERDVAKTQDLTIPITRQASDLLKRDAELRRFPIVVDGFKNQMRLKGKVATDAQKARAGRLVWSVPGVRSVENELEIERSPRK